MVGPASGSVSRLELGGFLEVRFLKGFRIQGLGFRV